MERKLVFLFLCLILTPHGAFTYKGGGGKEEGKEGLAGVMGLAQGHHTFMSL